MSLVRVRVTAMNPTAVMSLEQEPATALRLNRQPELL
jgi:hypothetical protein